MANNIIIMRKALILILFMASFTFIQAQKKRIIFFGDSITELGVQPNGYISFLNKMLEKNKVNDYELIGAGVGGNKVYDLYLRLDDDVLKQNPDVVVIWIGVNDVWHKRSLGTGTDADKFEKFYTAIIKKLKQENIKVYLSTPAVIGERTDFSNELDGDLNKYSVIIRDLAKKNNCSLIDLRKAFLDYNLIHNKSNKESGILTNDRVHLNEAGNTLVAEEMYKALLKQ